MKHNLRLHEFLGQISFYVKFCAQYDLMYRVYCLMGYEGLEVVNPEGGTADAEEEARRGRWTQTESTYGEADHG